MRAERERLAVERAADEEKEKKAEEERTMSVTVMRSFNRVERRVTQASQAGRGASR